MEGAISSLRGIHALSVTQYEEEMSSFWLHLRKLRMTGFKWIPSYSTFVLPHFMSNCLKE